MAEVSISTIIKVQYFALVLTAIVATSILLITPYQIFTQASLDTNNNTTTKTSSINYSSCSPTTSNGIKVGKNPIAVAVNPTTNKVYVPIFGDPPNTISVIDGSINRLKNNISLKNFHISANPPSANPHAIAINNNTNMMYMADKYGNGVSVIDGSTNDASFTIPYKSKFRNGFLLDVAVNPKTNMIYVSSQSDNQVSVINGSTNKIVKNITVGASPVAIAVNPTINMVYVANKDSNTITQINGSSNAIAGRPLKVALKPFDLAVNPKTNMVYVANLDANRVSVINGSTNNNNKVIKTIFIGNYTALDVNPLVPHAAAIAVDPDTNIVYVARAPANKISVISGSTNKVISNIRIDNPSALSVNPNNKMIYVVAGYEFNTVYVIDSKTNCILMGHVTNQIEQPGIKLQKNYEPLALAVDPSLNKVYVLYHSNNIISVIDSKTNTITDSIKVEASPYTLAVNPSTDMVYVIYGDPTSKYCGPICGNVSIIDGNTNQRLRDISLPRGALPPFLTAIAVEPTSNMIYVYDHHNKRVSVINGITSKIVKEYNITARNPATDMAVDPRTNMIYVANLDDVFVIDGNTKNVTQPTKDKRGPYSVAVNPITNMVYVDDHFTNTISIIDGYTDNVTSVKFSYSNPSGIAVNPSTNMIYVSNQRINAVYALNGSTNKVIGNFTLGAPLFYSKLNPNIIAVNPHTNIVYVANQDSNTITQISGRTNKVMVGVTFNINPHNSGVITCTDKNIVKNMTQNEYASIDVGSQCKAEAANGFKFSSWSGSLVSNLNDNSTITATINPSKYGNLTANFSVAPTSSSVALPPEFWASFYAILTTLILTPLASWLVPYIGNHLSEKRRTKYLAIYLSKIDRVYESYSQNREECKHELDKIRIEITDLLQKGMIGDSSYQILDSKIRDYSSALNSGLSNVSNRSETATSGIKKYTSNGKIIED